MCDSGLQKGQMRTRRMYTARPPQFIHSKPFFHIYALKLGCFSSKCDVNDVCCVKLWKSSLTWGSVGAELWSGCGGWTDDVLMVTFLSDRLLLSRLCDLCRSLPLRSLHDRDRHNGGGEGNAVAMVMWSRVREADWGHDNYCHHSSFSPTDTRWFSPIIPLHILWLEHLVQTRLDAVSCDDPNPSRALSRSPCLSISHD